VYKKQTCVRMRVRSLRAQFLLGSFCSGTLSTRLRIHVCSIRILYTEEDLCS